MVTSVVGEEEETQEVDWDMVVTEEAMSMGMVTVMIMVMVGAILLCRVFIHYFSTFTITLGK